MTLSWRALIKPELRIIAERLRARGREVDAALLRDLRDFGLACFALGVRHAHETTTIPAPADDTKGDP